jgi:GDP-4-dehydro-6-deoxy-D-mannose reductase
MAKRVLITGIAGFAGSHLTELLLEDGAEVCGLVFPGESIRNIEPVKAHVELSTCDIRDPEAVSKAVELTSPDAIYHLAAITFIPDSIDDPRLTFETNLYGTMNILEAATKSANAARILFVGSADEYGLVTSEEIPIGERAPLRPLNPYSVSKASAGMLAYQYAVSGGLHVIRVRPFNHTGPRQSPRFVCSDFARQIVEVEKGIRPSEVSVGNLDPLLDFTDVRDVVRAYRDVLKDGESGEVYNICSGRSISIGEILKKLLSITDQELRVIEQSDRLRKASVKEIRGDCGKIETAVGWRPSIPLDRTLEDLVEYWRENR